MASPTEVQCHRRSSSRHHWHTVSYDIYWHHLVVPVPVKQVVPQGVEALPTTKPASCRSFVSVMHYTALYKPGAAAAQQHTLTLMWIPPGGVDPGWVTRGGVGRARGRALPGGHCREGYGTYRGGIAQARRASRSRAVGTGTYCRLRAGKGTSNYRTSTGCA